MPCHNAHKPRRRCREEQQGSAWAGAGQSGTAHDTLCDAPARYPRAHTCGNTSAAHLHARALPACPRTQGPKPPPSTAAVLRMALPAAAHAGSSPAMRKRLPSFCCALALAACRILSSRCACAFSRAFTSSTALLHGPSRRAYAVTAVRRREGVCCCCNWRQGSAQHACTFLRQGVIVRWRARVSWRRGRASRHGGDGRASRQDRWANHIMCIRHRARCTWRGCAPMQAASCACIPARMRGMRAPTSEVPTCTLSPSCSSSLSLKFAKCAARLNGRQFRTCALDAKNARITMMALTMASSPVMAASQRVLIAHATSTATRYSV